MDVLDAPGNSSLQQNAEKSKDQHHIYVTKSAARNRTLGLRLIAAQTFHGPHPHPAATSNRVGKAIHRSLHVSVKPPSMTNVAPVM
ncbi:hypothetical protein Pan54_15070 [Rubinisphaera italica]|uniref:Uncharacterized protein n=1 Tax=Rubinisphaera italica TaxID=2527969 RepID=A0A5C5XCS7_9PLAN|nr:hypothetical protein Pan54_15070 [Rubinisphaera italica]